ncbi:MAG TPA: FkbM family methyltransferase [Kofleriaceae bacterium]|nr:FkbM family methyltransferase [Kofleriaceae bacterium]
MAGEQGAVWRLRALFHRGLRVAGLQIGRYPARNSLEAHLRRVLAARGVNIVLDVGGHHGEFAQQLRAIGYGGRIASFEPVRATHEVLARNARADRDWRVYNLALGAEDGTQEINLYGGAVFNSFRSTTELVSTRFGRAAERRGTERVQIRRLDHVFAGCVAGIARPRAFLKLDTQGWDLEVLEGARGVLGSIVAMQSELAVKQCYEGMPRYVRALEHCEALGFELAGMFPVAHTSDGLRLIEVDCVFVASTGSGS